MTSFIDRYLHICGDSEVPGLYNLWSGIALVAAAVADRVWVTKFGRLTPNMYIALLGPSGNGKDTAIDTMMELAIEHPRIGALNFRSTAPALLQYMTRSRTTESRERFDNSRIFLVMPEVSMSLRKGDIADDFIKTIGAMYSRKPYPLHDVTITRDHKVLKEYCVNVIIGSVLEWLLDVIPHTAISGGTFGRFVGVHTGYDYAKRVEMPTRPADYDRVVGRLHNHLRLLTELEGEFTLSAHARMLMSAWYAERSAPDDESLAPAWKRQHDLILKLGMILALADSPVEPLVIKTPHVVRAQALSDMVIRRLGDLQAAAATSRDTQGVVFVRQIFKALRRPVMRTELLKRIVAKGIGGAQALDQIMWTLEEAGEVTHRDSGRSRVYLPRVGGQRPTVRAETPAEPA